MDQKTSFTRKKSFLSNCQWELFSLLISACCVQLVRMHLTRLIYQRLTRNLMSNKTGWGPYRMHRKGVFFVGTEPSVLKYHLVSLFSSILCSIFSYKTSLHLNRMVYRATTTWSRRKAKSHPSCQRVWWWRKIKSMLGVLVAIAAISLYATALIWLLLFRKRTSNQCDSFPIKTWKFGCAIVNKRIIGLFAVRCFRINIWQFVDLDGSHKNIKSKDDKDSLFE